MVVILNFFTCLKFLVSRFSSEGEAETVPSVLTSVYGGHSIFVDCTFESCGGVRNGRVSWRMHGLMKSPLVEILNKRPSRSNQ